ncbi:hypothetical protein [Edaphocola aurantiacus]|uniref:hypothetical protein n=1 Tax=Edaphocola aurantiacus TaxID=2601682 RepID=UPI001C9829A0|nr:hypothetical protein [Edaphocola aurantiacus]
MAFTPEQIKNFSTVERLIYSKIYPGTMSFSAAEINNFSTVERLLFAMNNSTPPTPVTPTLQLVTASGNVTQNGIIIDRTSDNTGRLVFRDRSSRPGFSAGTMSVIMFPTAAAIWGDAYGCAIIKLGAYASDNTANMFVDARFLDPYGTVKTWNINSYVHTNNVFVCNDYDYFKDKPVRLMTDANGILHIVIGTDATFWRQPRLQVINVVARWLEDQSTVSAYFGTTTGLTLFSDVTKRYAPYSADYRPVFSNMVNCTVAPISGLYTLTDGFVDINATVDIIATDPFSDMTFDMSLAVPSDFTDIKDVVGSVVGNGTQSNKVLPNIADNLIRVTLNNPTTGHYTLPIQLKYKVK